MNIHTHKHTHRHAHTVLLLEVNRDKLMKGQTLSTSVNASEKSVPT